MNYRHAYHAGNHTEVFKHAVLVQLLKSLHAKEKPFFILDTHAGLGLYNLDSEEAQKTAEADQGIGRVYNSSSEVLRPYLELVHRLNQDGLKYYPGSPALISEMLRPGDRAVFCELHDGDFPILRRFLSGRPATSAHHRSGYEAMLAFVPPPERRGLVFVDPPYEAKDELEQLATHLVAAYKKWNGGIFACWYPIKDRSSARLLKAAAQERFLQKSLFVEFVPYPIDGEILAGSGMLIVNTPWKFDGLLRELCSELASEFRVPANSWSLEWICEPT